MPNCVHHADCTSAVSNAQHFGRRQPRLRCWLCSLAPEMQPEIQREGAVLIFAGQRLVLSNYRRASRVYQDRGASAEGPPIVPYYPIYPVYPVYPVVAIRIDLFLGPWDLPPTS